MGIPSQKAKIELDRTIAGAIGLHWVDCSATLSKASREQLSASQCWKTAPKRGLTNGLPLRVQ